MGHVSPLIQGILDNIGESAAVIFLGALALSASKIKNWWGDRAIRAFERGINQNVRLRELLSELRVPYAADRVCLYQFHNGEYYHSGDSIMKCSLTHFVTKIGVSNPPSVQNIPTTQMIMSLKALQDNAVFEFHPESFDDDSFQDSLFQNSGTEVCLGAVVRNSRGSWIGILCICWTSGPKPADHAQLLTYSKLVGQFLSVKK